MSLSVLRISLAFVFLFSFCACANQEATLVAQYKSNITLDCSNSQNDVKFYQVRSSGNATELGEGEKAILEDKKLTLFDIRGDVLNSKFECREGDQTVKTFTLNVAPALYKPEKASQTVSEGGEVELKCILLHGNQNPRSELKWSWKKNDTELSDDDEKYEISVVNGTSTLLIKRVTNQDKGDYVCELKNDYGSVEQVIQVRVKDALAALWPFLAIVAEVLILCVIILIYEKKCAKKPSQNDEDNEQSQNLMGANAHQSSDVKKRSPK